MDPRDEIVELKRVCEKIIQFYRIRLRCLIRRRELLESIGYDFNKLDQKTYQALDALIQKEYKLLDIARRADRAGENNIVYAFSVVSKAVKNMPSGVLTVGKTRISGKALLKFLKETINLLLLMEKEAARIEKRLVLEDAFLKSRQPGHFNKFVNEWKAEIKESQDVIKTYGKVLSRNQKIIIDLQRKKKEAWELFKLAGYAGVPTAALSVHYGASSTIAIAAAAVFYGTVVAALFVGLYPLMRKEFVQDKDSMEILNKFRYAPG